MYVPSAVAGESQEVADVAVVMSPLAPTATAGANDAVRSTPWRLTLVLDACDVHAMDPEVMQLAAEHVPITPPWPTTTTGLFAPLVETSVRTADEEI